MAGCKACGCEPARVYPVQEVLTLHIRGMQERRAQALGERLEVPLCDACLDQYVSIQAEPKPALVKAGLGFGVMLVLAILMFVFLGAGSVPDLRLAGALLAGFSVLGFRQRWLKITGAARQAKEGTEEERRARFMGAFLHTLLPQKSGENDLSYIPLDEDTLSLSAAQLAARHRLLPQIALQLHKRLRGEEVALPPKAQDTAPL